MAKRSRKLKAQTPEEKRKSLLRMVDEIYKITGRPVTKADILDFVQIQSLTATGGEKNLRKAKGVAKKMADRHLGTKRSRKIDAPKHKASKKAKRAKTPAKKRSRHAGKTFGMSSLERQYKHILESNLDRGKSLKVAERIAAATVNKQRAKRAKAGKGPKLVGKGGSRRQWYPGKGTETLVCLKHQRRFGSKAALLRHYKSHRKGK